MNSQGGVISESCKHAVNIASTIESIDWSFLTLFLVKLFLVVQLQQRLLVALRYHSFFIHRKYKNKRFKKLKIFKISNKLRRLKICLTTVYLKIIKTYILLLDKYHPDYYKRKLLYLYVTWRIFSSNSAFFNGKSKDF